MNTRIINFLIFTGFSVLATIGIFHHELWSDHFYGWRSKGLFPLQKEVAAYIKANQLENHPILANSCLDVCFIAYLPAKAYFLSQGHWGAIASGMK